MTIETMREIISGCYKGASWKNRCRQMSDDQVIAIYYNFQETGKFSADKNGKKPPKMIKAGPIQEIRAQDQLSFFELNRSSDDYIRT